MAMIKTTRKLQILKQLYSNTLMEQSLSWKPAIDTQMQKEATISLTEISFMELMGTWNIQADGKHSAQGKNNLLQVRELEKVKLRQDVEEGVIYMPIFLK